MSFNYSKLRGRIREIFNTQEKFANAMGISTTSLSAKLNNKVEFDQSEINQAMKLLKINGEDIPAYFFTLQVQKGEQKEV